MATITAHGTTRAPRIALSATLQRTQRGLAQIADVAAGLSVLTALVGDQDDPPPPLDLTDADPGGIAQLAVVEHDDAPLVITGGGTGWLDSFRLDGTRGPLLRRQAHIDTINALAIVEHDAQLLIVSGSGDGRLLSFGLDGAPGTLAQAPADGDSILAIVAVEHDGAPLIVAGREGGSLRSVWLDGTPGPLQEPDVGFRVAALAPLEHDGAPLIVAGVYGDVRSFRLDGTPGALQVEDEHDGPITAMAVVDRGGRPFVAVGDDNGVVRSFNPDGTPGPLPVVHAEPGGISAMAVVESLGETVIVTAGNGSPCALHSFKLDGNPGPLQVPEPHPDGAEALAVVVHNSAPLIITGGRDGALRSWRVAARIAVLERAAAHEVQVRELSIGSLRIVIVLPPDVLTAAWVSMGLTATAATAAGLAKVMDAIKRVAGFPAELRLQDVELEVAQLRAEAERLDAGGDLAEARARHRRRQLEAAGWEVESVTITDEGDPINDEDELADLG